MRLVFVEWLDAFGCSPNWEHLGDSAPQLLTCKSVGWLLHDNADAKVLVPHVTTPNDHCVPQGCGDMTIPTRAILRLVDLDEPTAA